MQLGARWQVGELPHRSVPPTLHAAIAAQETLHPDAAAWTLTWLEGRPRLALDDTVMVTVNAAGSVIVEELQHDRMAGIDEPDPDDDDDWLS